MLFLSEEGGSPRGRHSRPAFLQSPTSSFFFVSTEIAGWFLAMAVMTASLMTGNCASRHQRRLRTFQLVGVSAAASTIGIAPLSAANDGGCAAV